MLVVKKRTEQTIENTPSEWKAYKDGVEFEIYGYGHPLFIAASNMYERRIKSVDELELTENDADLAKQIKIAGRYLIKDWKGIQGEDGEPLEVNADNFVDIVVSDPKVYGFVLDSAIDIQKAYSAKVEDTKKKPLSGGSGLKKAKN